VLINTFNPCLNSFESSFVGQTESNQNAMCLSVEILSDSPELLLASGIPYFNLKGMPIHFKLGLNTFNTDGFLVLLVHGLVVVHRE
jgi:hypothetical protein